MFKWFWMSEKTETVVSLGYLLSHDEMAEWISLVLECDLSLGSATYNRRHLDFGPFQKQMIQLQWRNMVTWSKQQYIVNC